MIIYVRKNSPAGIIPSGELLYVNYQIVRIVSELCGGTTPSGISDLDHKAVLCSSGLITSLNNFDAFNNSIPIS